MSNNQPRTEFSQALKAIVQERGLDANTIIDAIKQAIIAAFRRDQKEAGIEYGEEVILDAEINSLDGGAKVSIDGKDVTPPGFGRIAAQTAKQVILQKIREAEKETIANEFKSKEGEIVSGLVQRIEGSTIYVDIGKTLGLLNREEQIPGEYYKPGQRVKCYILKVEDTSKGSIVLLSRVYPKLVSRLFELEVPEITAGTVVIKAIAREPGFRTKMAVASTEDGIDPIGSCVGQRGTRIIAVINELGGEKIDVVEWTEKPEKFIANSLSPAKVSSVKVEDKNTATVFVPEDQLSLAIGKDGRNVRLAANLTGWKIDIKPALKEEENEEKIEEVKEDKPVKEKKVKKSKKKKGEEPEEAK